MRLSYKVTLSTYGILLVIGIIGGIFILDLQRQSAEYQFEESALLLAEAVHDSLANDMMQAQREHIQEAVIHIASRGNINEVNVINSDLNIIASAETDEIGQTRDDEYLARVVASKEVVVRTEKRYGNEELCVILPIINQPECHICHGSAAEVLGAIEVGLDKGPLENQFTEQWLVMGMMGGITFAVVGIALAFITQSQVGTPLKRLAASAQKISDGEFSARTKVSSKDEVGMLAHTFNEMAGHIEEYAGALEDSKRELEQRVIERTKQLHDMVVIRGQLLERLISAQEEERRRIARELHDEAGQALTMVMLNLARIMDTLPKDADIARNKLSQTRSLTEQTLIEVRKLIYELRPEVLDQLGLIPALRSYVKTRLEAANIDVRLKFFSMQERLSPQVEITLFRIMQEAITNILRHSGATQVEIEMSLSNSKVDATIADNGKGFDVEAVLKSSDSWGLRGIRERITVIGGELSIDSAPGQGTRLRVQIPLEYQIHEQTANSDS